MKKVFVTSITGAQGRHIAEAFKASGYAVASMTRQKIDLDGFEIMSGELGDTEKLSPAMNGAETVVLTLPLLFDPSDVVAITDNIIKAAKIAGVKKIIYNTGIPLGDAKTGYAAIDVKHDALAVLQQSGLDLVTLMPTIYLDNLASPFLLPVIKEHKILPYPLPDEFEFSWTSQENLGRYCVAAAETPALIGEKVLVSNRDEISKLDLAELIGKALGCDVHYVATTPEQFEENLQPVLGEYVATEIANLYRGISEHHQDFVAYTHQGFLDSVELQTAQEWVEQVNWS